MNFYDVFLFLQYISLDETSFFRLLFLPGHLLMFLFKYPFWLLFQFFYGIIHHTRRQGSVVRIHVSPSSFFCCENDPRKSREEKSRAGTCESVRGSTSRGGSGEECGRGEECGSEACNQIRRRLRERLAFLFEDD